MSCDEDLGLAYLPFSTPTNDYYGGERPGDNLFAESLVAVDVDTGERAWHYQMVHHGIWDYDLPAAPNLLDITVDGRPDQGRSPRSPSMASCSCLTARPERPSGPSKSAPCRPRPVPGEQTAATQPFPTRPAPFEQQGATVDDLIDFTPALRNQAAALVAQHDLGPAFHPTYDARHDNRTRREWRW